MSNINPGAIINYMKSLGRGSLEDATHRISAQVSIKPTNFEN